MAGPQWSFAVISLPAFIIPLSSQETHLKHLIHLNMGIAESSQGEKIRTLWKSPNRII